MCFSFTQNTGSHHHLIHLWWFYSATFSKDDRWPSDVIIHLLIHKDTCVVESFPVVDPYKVWINPFQICLVWTRSMVLYRSGLQTQVGWQLWMLISDHFSVWAVLWLVLRFKVLIVVVYSCPSFLSLFPTTSLLLLVALEHHCQWNSLSLSYPLNTHWLHYVI